MCLGCEIELLLVIEIINWCSLFCVFLEDRNVLSSGLYSIKKLRIDMFNSRVVSLFYKDRWSEGREYLSEKQQEFIDKINQPRPFGYILD